MSLTWLKNLAKIGVQAANSAAKPQRGCHRRRRRRRWEENYRLVIELCHLSRLPLAEMEWTKKGQRRD